MAIQKQFNRNIQAAAIDFAFVLRLFETSDDVFDDCDGQTPPILDVSTASPIVMLFQLPDAAAATLTETAGFATQTGLEGFVGDGTDGYIEFRTPDAAFLVPGEWKVQGRVVIGAGTFATGIERFKVHPNLDT